MTNPKIVVMALIEVILTSCSSKIEVEFFNNNRAGSSSNDAQAATNSSPSVSNGTSSNGTEDTESIITLSYTDSDGDIATSCSIVADANITLSSACSCDGAGVCTVGVTGKSGYFGAASFDYSVTANQATSNTALINYTIDSVIISCPAGFVAVDGNAILDTVDFCVMKYEAKCASDCNVTTDLPISQAAGLPWDMRQPGAGSSAQARCEAMFEFGFEGTFSLISNAEWMTIARDIESTASNWSSGIVGTGHIPRGHTDGLPAITLTVTDTNDPYIGTGNNSGELPGSGWEQKRTHNLSNGSEIWDLSGNANEWTDWDATSAGFTLGPVDEELAIKEFTTGQTGSLLNDDFLPDGLYTSANSFGRWEGGTGGAALRGGTRFSQLNAGVFMLTLFASPADFFPSTLAAPFGFRCIYRP